mmetsp:Transcript_10762/g.14482  ORF Transcript_10762/g.14482 Transcript_10762/m.14482 type:complete len:222 (-) Transcript_10762:7-672(-)
MSVRAILAEESFGLELRHARFHELDAVGGVSLIRHLHLVRHLQRIRVVRHFHTFQVEGDVAAILASGSRPIDRAVNDIELVVADNACKGRLLVFRGFYGLIYLQSEDAPGFIITLNYNLAEVRVQHDVLKPVPVVVEGSHEGMLIRRDVSTPLTLHELVLGLKLQRVAQGVDFVDLEGVLRLDESALTRVFNERDYAIVGSRLGLCGDQCDEHALIELHHL